MLEALAKKWKIDTDDPIDDLATALFLEKHYWKNMQIAIANGIAQAFNG